MEWFVWPFTCNIMICVLGSYLSCLSSILFNTIVSFSLGPYPYLSFPVFNWTFYVIPVALLAFQWYLPPSTFTVNLDRSEVESQPLLYSKFEVSLGYITDKKFVWAWRFMTIIPTLGTLTKLLNLTSNSWSIRKLTELVNSDHLKVCGSKVVLLNVLSLRGNGFLYFFLSLQVFCS